MAAAQFVTAEGLEVPYFTVLVLAMTLKATDHPVPTLSPALGAVPATQPAPLAFTRSPS